MANNFDELEDELGFEEQQALVDEDVLDKKLQFDRIFLDCAMTKEGRRMLDTLKERFVDVAIYVPGSTLEDTSYRQGKADLIRDIFKAVEDALTPRKPD